MAITVSEENGIFQFSGRSYNITKDKNAALEPYGKIVHNYGIVLELLPDEKQKEDIHQQIGNARFVRNRYLYDRNAYYSENKKTLSVSAYKKDHLPRLKEEFPFLKLSDKFALEAALEHVNRAFQNFFDKRTGFPKSASRWKPSGNQYTTKFTNNNIAVLEKDGLPYLKLPKLGSIRFILPKKRSLDSIVPKGTSILSASIKRKGDHYTASLQLETVITKPETVSGVYIRNILAADIGIKSFMVIGGLDETEAVANPRWIRIHEKRLRRLQKSLSRKQYDAKTHTGSNNWLKAKRRVAAEYRKLTNQRKDYQHKLSRAVADACDVFVCEDLNIRGMLKNHRLSKEISSAGWGQFLTFVKYKMERMGKHFLQVDRWFPSSQRCSCCGYKNPEVKDLKVREWMCPCCGAVHDRDANAKDNIAGEGIRILKENGIRIFV